MPEQPGAEALVALLLMAPALPEAEAAQKALHQRCLALIRREQENGRASAAACHHALTALYGVGDTESLLVRLAGEIAAGGADGDGARAIRDLLWTLTIAKLRLSNPDFLAAVGL